MNINFVVMFYIAHVVCCLCTYALSCKFMWVWSACSFTNVCLVGNWACFAVCTTLTYVHRGGMDNTCMMKQQPHSLVCFHKQKLCICGALSLHPMVAVLSLFVFV